MQTVLFLTVALLSIFPSPGKCGRFVKEKVAPQYRYLCRNAVGMKVCHPIFENKFIQCSTSGKDPVEHSCKLGFKFSSIRQKCTFAQYGDCLPNVTPEEASSIQCPELLDPPHGKLHCSDKNQYDSLCLLACIPSYKRQGVVAVRCVLAGDEGRWSGMPGRCVSEATLANSGETVKPIECPAFQEIAAGDVFCSRGYFIDSVCSLKCFHGYEVVGNQLTTCSANGMWRSSLGVCKKPAVKCPVIDDADVVCSDCPDGSCGVGAKCLLNCSSEDEAFGKTESVCADDGSWSETLGRCRKTCSPLLRNNSDVSCANSGRSLTCTLACLTGYRVSGSQAAICDASTGNWNVMLGSCEEERVCSSLSPPTNGELLCSDGGKMLPSTGPFKNGAQCFVTCDVSHKLIGQHVLTCSDDGRWDFNAGKCVPKCDLADLPSASSGSWLCSGDVSLVCNFKCNSRNDPESVSTSCVSGVWTRAEVPSCKEQKKCLALPSVENGLLSCSDSALTNGTRCTVTCDDGYVLRGASTIHCIESFWDGRPGRCEAKCREESLTADHGKWHCTGSRLLSCRLSCNDGYEVLEPLATCADGVWRKSSESECVKTIKHCPLIMAPEKGFIRCESEFYPGRIFDVSRINAPAGTTCEIGCQVGFEHVGSVAVNCSSDGYWSSSVGLCQRACNENQLQPLSDGDWVCVGEAALDCSVRCDKQGLSGTVAAKCRKGEWNVDDKAMKICQRRVCPLLPTVLHGKVTCIGADNLEATFDPARIEASSNSACTLLCEDQYFSEGPELAYCDGEGNWDIKLGVCKEKVSYCPSILPPENGYLLCSNANGTEKAERYLRPIAGSVCKIKCREGFNYFGTESLICFDEKWSHSVGLCKKICVKNQLPTVGYGRWDCRGTTDIDCDLSCDDFRRSSVSTVRCRDGEWNLGVERPSCDLIVCPLLNKRPNGKVSCMNADSLDILVDPTEVNVRGNAVCQLLCSEGYRRIGSQTTLCSSDGDWELRLGSCEKSCDVKELRVIQNGKWQCSANSLRSDVESLLCVPNCDDGYVINLPERARCVNGVWTLPKAKISCSKALIECPLLPLPENGATRCFSDQRSREVVDRVPAYAGTTCQTVCNDGFSYRGPALFNCTDAGAWTLVGSCHKECDPTTLPKVELGMWSCTRGHVLECLFSCPSGYERSLTETVRCQRGSWSIDLAANSPSCQKERCSKLAPTSNGRVTCTSSSGEVDPSLEAPRIQSACQLNCDRGYVQVGTSVSFCIADGHYNAELGNCEKQCDQSQLATIYHGKWRCEKSGENSLQCYSDCSDGFRSESEVLANCENGRWSDYVVPKCHSLNCREISTPTNGQISCSSNVLASGTTCVLLCNPGFTLTGTAVTVCSSGSWTNSFGKCVSACSIAMVPETPHGSWYCDERESSSCQLRCDFGFVSSIKGATLGCVSGSWDYVGAPARCVPTAPTVLSTPTAVIEDASTRCPAPLLSAGGSFTCEKDAGFPFTPSGTIASGVDCQVKCATGFYLHGTASAYCQRDGEWSATLGSCRPICTQDQLSDVENGSWRCKGLENLSCTLKCDSGFEGISATATCNNGAWEKSLNPACNPVAVIDREFVPESTSDDTEPEVSGGKPSPSPSRPVSPVNRPDIRIEPPTISNVPIFRSLGTREKAPAFYCRLPSGLPKELSCPSAMHGRVPLGQSCFLQCEGQFETTSKCTRQGWLPNVAWLSCPTFRLYEFNVKCTKPKPVHGSAVCKHNDKLFQGDKIPGSGVCSLVCDKGYRPTWATESTCLESGHWDNWLGCV